MRFSKLSNNAIKITQTLPFCNPDHKPTFSLLDLKDFQMIYNPKISKCDFDPTNESIRFFVGKSGKKRFIKDLNGPRMVKDSVKYFFKKLCEENNVDESEIKFYDDSIGSDAEDAKYIIGTNFRIYFRGHQFLFSYDIFETVTYEVIEHDFGGFIKKDESEINEFLESCMLEEKMRSKGRRGSGNSWRKPPPDDEDYCTGEYYWNID